MGKEFFEYAIENDIEGAKKAIEEGIINIHSTNKRKQTALHLALYHKHFEFAYFLLDNTNIDIEAIDEFGNSPLMCLLSFPHRNDKKTIKSISKDEIFKLTIYLIEIKNVERMRRKELKKFHGKSSFGFSILDISIINHQYEVAKYLINKKNYNVINFPEFKSTLYRAMKENVDEEFLIYIEEIGGIRKEENLFFFLHFAISRNYFIFAVHLYKKYFFIDQSLLILPSSQLPSHPPIQIQEINNNNNKNIKNKYNENRYNYNKYNYNRYSFNKLIEPKFSIVHLHFVHLLVN